MVFYFFFESAIFKGRAMKIFFYLENSVQFNKIIFLAILRDLIDIKFDIQRKETDYFDNLPAEVQS